MQVGEEWEKDVDVKVEGRCEVLVEVVLKEKREGAKIEVIMLSTTRSDQRAALSVDAFFVGRGFVLGCVCTMPGWHRCSSAALAAANFNLRSMSLRGSSCTTPQTDRIERVREGTGCILSDIKSRQSVEMRQRESRKARRNEGEVEVRKKEEMKVREP